MTKHYNMQVFSLLIALLMSNCGSSPAGSEIPIGPDITYGVSAAGIIKKPDATAYGYGAHVLFDSSGNILYALKSDTISLDDYIGMKGTAKGDLVSGYPIEGGPDLLKVKRIEQQRRLIRPSDEQDGNFERRPGEEVVGKSANYAA